MAHQSHSKMSKVNPLDRAWMASDPVAAAIGYLVTILAVLGVFSKLGLSTDQVATLGGALGGLGATLRAIHEKNRRIEAQRLESTNSEPKPEEPKPETSA